ncbi:MAG: hypothetical protein FWF53_12540 [Candidatus Azobacteroides sp.]|nr:hypothetical protein [Candidatus Azobacteroides sp.]
MKKLLITILIFLFTTAAISNAGFFRESSDPDRSEKASDNYGGFFKNDNRNFSSETSNDYGGFFRASDADGPGDRPDSGGGIGQDAPTGDGLFTLIACCAVWIVVKLFNEKRKKVKPA